MRVMKSCFITLITHLSRVKELWAASLLIGREERKRDRERERETAMGKTCKMYVQLRGNTLCSLCFSLRAVKCVHCSGGAALSSFWYRDKQGDTGQWLMKQVFFLESWGGAQNRIGVTTLSLFWWWLVHKLPSDLSVMSTVLRLDLLLGQHLL